MQIDRAKQQLAKDRRFPESHAAIQAMLDQGRVKPVFHALDLPETFLNNRLSFCDDVTVGQVDETRVLKFDFDCDNLDQVVNKSDMKGAGSIIDSGLGASWEFSRKQAAFAVELILANA